MVTRALCLWFNFIMLLFWNSLLSLRNQISNISKQSVQISIKVQSFDIEE